ncbi:hypothetical protein LIP_2921 [Limnochorda pilosa]|uniref:Uncharacterized protein n=1 Tax=Limnochorda pilosa TaxID=1555112 RepID=A0A0K2SNR4_LIMPI|nr:hypothetical protein LIP_2921 [Limnochorda pilosa]
MPGEGDEIVEVFPQDPVDLPQVDFQVLADHNVTKTCHAGEVTREASRKHAEISQREHVVPVFVAYCPSVGCHEVGGHVQHLLRAELQPMLDRPVLLRRRGQRFKRESLEAPKHLHRVEQVCQVFPNDAVVVRGVGEG